MAFSQTCRCGPQDDCIVHIRTNEMNLNGRHICRCSRFDLLRFPWSACTRHQLRGGGAFARNSWEVASCSLATPYFSHTSDAQSRSVTSQVLRRASERPDTPSSSSSAGVACNALTAVFQGGNISYTLSTRTIAKQVQSDVLGTTRAASFVIDATLRRPSLCSQFASVTDRDLCPQPVP